MYVDMSGLRRCEQSWDRMRPVAGGRLCAGCDRLIVDFRPMSLAEIAERHGLSEQPVCGIYSPRQLGQTLPSRYPLPIRAAAAAFGTMLCAAAPAAGQTGGAPVTVQPADSASAPAVGAHTRMEAAGRDQPQVRLVIQGTLRMRDGSPVAGAVVAVLEQQLTTTTDAQGRYTLRVPAQGPAPDSIRFMRLGLAPLHHPVPPASAGTITIDAVMDAAAIELTAFYVTGHTQPGILRRLGRAIRSIL